MSGAVSLLPVYTLKVCRANSHFLLGTFVESQKAATSFVVPICPSVRMEQVGSHRTDFHEIWYTSIFFFRKICGQNSNFIKI